MITLYSIPPSLYSAKTRLVLRAKGLEWTDVPPPGGYGSDEYKQIVPTGTLPAIDHDGFVLAESEAINEYLNEVYPDPAMLPADPRQRAQARALSRFHDTRLEPALRAIFPHVAPGRRDSTFVTKQAQLLSERLSQLTQIADPSPLLFGERLSLADCGYPISFLFVETLAELMEFSVEWPVAIRAYVEALQNDKTVAAEFKTYRPTVLDWATKTSAG